MENDDGRNNRSSADPALPTTTDSPSDQAENSNKPRRTSQKPGSDKKKSYRRSWRSTSPIRKVELIALALGAAAGICYVVVAIWGNLQTKWNFEAEHRPHVIFSKPPELTGTLSCEIVNNVVSSHTGAMNFWLKNIGRGDADAFFSGPEFRFVPENHTAAAEVDSSSSVTEACKQSLDPHSMREVRINGGQEIKMPMVQSAGRQSVHIPITENTNFQLYAPICVYYLDSNQEHHATCRMYRLSVTGGENADSTTFECRKNSPISGTFQETLFAYCEN
jgi:hypothetical protein